jgi:ABC-type transporter Mla subunit MlaD
MRRHETRRVLMGSALIAGILAVSAFVFLLGNVRSFLQGRYELIVVFANAPRLRVGSPVWIGGHEVGRVTAIGLLPVRADSTPRVAVHVEIPRKHQSLLRGDSRARLTSARMIGESVVNISPGTEATSALEPGDTVHSLPTANLLSAFQIWRGFQSAIDSLVRVSRVLQPQIAQRKPQLVRLAASVQHTRAEFTRVTDMLGKSSITDMITGGELQAALGNLGKTAQDRSALGRMSTHADSLSAQLNSLREQLGRGTAQRFVRDSAIQKTLRKTQLELDSLMAETKRNPLRFWLGNRK